MSAAPATTRPGAGSSTATAAGPEDSIRWSGKVVASTSGLSDAVDLDMRPPRSIDDTASDADLSVRRLAAGQADVSKAALGLPSFFDARQGTVAFDVVVWESA